MKQPELPLLHFPYQPYLAHFKRTRKALAPSNFVPPWRQLRLPLFLRNLMTERSKNAVVT